MDFFGFVFFAVGRAVRGSVAAVWDGGVENGVVRRFDSVEEMVKPFGRGNIIPLSSEGFKTTLKASTSLTYYHHHPVPYLGLFDPQTD